MTSPGAPTSYGAPRAATPLEDSDYDPTNPPLGELGSSFTYDAPFGAFDDGNVFAVQEPMVKDYQHMLATDGKAAAIELMLSYPIISAPWSIEPAKGDTGEAEFIYDALTALPHQGGPKTTVEQLVSQMTAAFTNRVAFFEKVFKVNDDNKIVYDKIALRPPETCQLAFDARRAEVTGFRQMPVIYEAGNYSPLWSSGLKDWIFVPNKRAFTYVHGTWRDPLLGASNMRVVYWCYQTKRKIRWLWYQLLDQSVLPKTIVYNPDENQAKIDAKKVSMLRGRGVVALENTSEVKAYEASGKASTEYQAAMNYLDNEMLDSGLLGFFGLSSAAGEGKGSFALAESLSEMFHSTRRYVAVDMARQITNDVIGPLVAYNFGPKGTIPRFKFGPLNKSNQSQLMDIFSKVATTGAKVPVEFYDQLIAAVATALELDPGKVAKDLEVNGSPQETDNLQQMMGTVDTATTMVANAQTQGRAPGTRAAQTSSPTSGRVGTRPFGERSVVNKK
jgi:hypothetical protein